MANEQPSSGSKEGENEEKNIHSGTNDCNDVEGITRAFGKCKWFSSMMGYGFITPDKQEGEETPGESRDVFVYQDHVICYNYGRNLTVESLPFGRTGTIISNHAADNFLLFNRSSKRVIQMPGFRSLKEGESVLVYYKPSEKGFEATLVCGPDGKDCVGTERKPKRKKKPDRCYNCDGVGHHAKQCSFSPLPKKCHHCKSVEHLVINCPVKHLCSHKETSDSQNSSISSIPYPANEQNNHDATAAEGAA